jgi:DNA recombination protein RmuC
MELIYLSIGLAVGAVLSFFYLKSKSVEVSDEAINRSSLVGQLRNDIQKSDEKLTKENIEKVGALRSLAGEQEKVKGLEDRLSDQEKRIVQIREEMAKDFELLANKIFDEKQKKASEINLREIGTVLQPFRDKLKDFELKVDKVYQEENNERINLKAEIRLLSELNKQLSSDANNLAVALKGDNKTQGNWGEFILEKILERSGLRNGVEYKTQQSASNREEDLIRPDVVVFLPDDKHLIIDSKVSLIAYDNMVATNADEDHARYLRAHCDSVRNHVKILGDKNYQTAQGFNSPDFVMLFMPIEAAFAAAMQGDAEIYNYAWERKVVIVSPTTLLATLRTVSSIWMQERRTRNAEAIAEEGGKLYDKLVAFVEDMQQIGSRIGQTQKAYDAALNKLKDGNGNLIRRAENMKKLGSKTTRSLPKEISELSEGEEES